MSEARCPICGQPSSAPFRPFCSARCADLDLHRWLSGRYAVPADPDDETAGDAIDGADDET